MITVLNDMKLKYKDPDTPKTYLVALRDAGVVLSNENILTESLEVSESICSASSFKVGLCESSVAKVTVNYPNNADGDEMSIIQILGDVDLTFTYPEEWTKVAMTISGDCVTACSFSSSDTFDPLKYYLLSVYTEYIGKAVYIYGEEANGSTRMIYYLSPGMYGFANLRDWDDQETYGLDEIVVHDDRVWQSRTNENTVEPENGINAWRNVTMRMHLLIPIIGYDFQSVYQEFYVPNGPDDDYADVWMNLYEIDYPVMPLGIYGIKSSKKRNDLPLRELLGYDRMQDVRLGADVNFEFEDQTAIIGDLLNTAAEGTAVIVGTNLSKADASVVVTGTATEAVPNFPTGILYTVNDIKEETITGTYKSQLIRASLYDGQSDIDYYKQYYGMRFYYLDYSAEVVQRPELKERVYTIGGVRTYEWEAYFNPQFGSEHNPNSGYYCSGYRLERSYHPSPEKITSIDYSDKSKLRMDGYEVYRYYRILLYDFDFTLPRKYTTENWQLVSETVVPGTMANPTATCTRLYRKVYFSGSWSESAVGTRITYQIQNYNPYDAVTNPNGIIYEVVAFNPLDVGAGFFEEHTLYGGWVQGHINDGGVPGVNNAANHQAVMNAIYNYSTHETITPDANGCFDITYVSTLIYTGYDNGSYAGVNPFRGVQVHSMQERFNSFEIGVTDNALHTTRRHVISSYLELNGLFINFNRYGISTFLTIVASTLYPAENLFPKDPAGQYGALYPYEGALERLADSYCQSIEIDDDINAPFDGVRISSSSDAGYTSGQTVKQFPFYYNRMDRKYGVVPYGMQQTGYWETNNYYEISGNFFFDYFTFTEAQLIAICETIIERIGDLQYFNLLAEIRALPYMEPGDSINIMTPKNGYETAILRRTIGGCIDQKDTIETDFY